MKVLFTGGSSFTGFWFIRQLAEVGHEVVATFRKPSEQYPDAVRRDRVSLALNVCRAIVGCSFGDSAFLKLIRHERWDVVCHHAANVTNYKSSDFDVLAAVADNTRNIAEVFDALQAQGHPTRLIVTGSVFENDEGAGSEGLPTFSPYGLSKSFTFQMFRHHARRVRIPLGKFVIANPFGPYEDPRFTAYLMKSWFANQTAAVNTPSYVRDNIHISLLAKGYVKFIEEFPTGVALHRIHPSGYTESQGDFTLRFAREMRERIKLPCNVELKEQSIFPEPHVRINTDIINDKELVWNEKAAWDGIAEYYDRMFRA
jgi:UDP-glucose 4-epimerase